MKRATNFLLLALATLLSSASADDRPMLRRELGNNGNGVTQLQENIVVDVENWVLNMGPACPDLTQEALYASGGVHIVLQGTINPNQDFVKLNVRANTQNLKAVGAVSGDTYNAQANEKWDVDMEFSTSYNDEGRFSIVWRFVKPGTGRAFRLQVESVVKTQVVTDSAGNKEFFSTAFINPGDITCSQ